MASGLPMISPSTARSVVNKLAPSAMRQIQSLGMTPRQQELNWLWSWYATCRYDSRKVNWDGSERVERVDAETIATAGVLPGGFYDAGADFPIQFRRPAAPYNLPRVIVNRFTGLLFAESQHPEVRCVGDPVTEDYVSALVQHSRLWAAMAQARTFGGATGTYVIGFKFLRGRPIIEVFDPRWVTPHWKTFETLELEAIEKRWMWPDYVLDDQGEWREIWYWTRRLIDEQADTVWLKIPVDANGKEPDWDSIKPDKQEMHGYGECPVVWGQNAPVSDMEDGEPDCLGVFDQIEEMDALISCSLQSLKKNLDPTMLILSNMRIAQLRKGSDNAIRLMPGDDARYVEANLEGPVIGFDKADKLRDYVLEVVQCVLDDPNDAAAQETATKSRMRYAAMTNRADMFREQYGQKGVIPLVEKMIRAIRKLKQKTITEDGRVISRAIQLPPREIVAKGGSRTYEPRELPESSQGVFELDWPPYFRPSVQDAQSAATAAGGARKAEVIDDETAARFLARFFDIKDVPAMLLKIKQQKVEDEKLAEERAAASWRGGEG